LRISGSAALIAARNNVIMKIAKTERRNGHANASARRNRLLSFKDSAMAIHLPPPKISTLHENIFTRAPKSFETEMRAMRFSAARISGDCSEWQPNNEHFDFQNSSFSGEPKISCFAD
jgi:hypothetical protein